MKRASVMTPVLPQAYNSEQRPGIVLIVPAYWVEIPNRECLRQHLSLHAEQRRLVVFRCPNLNVENALRRHRVLAHVQIRASSIVQFSFVRKWGVARSSR
jgi:hypothetical protein